MVSVLKKRAIADGAWLAACSLVLWLFGHQFDLFERVSSFLQRHEALELDELALGLSCVGLVGFVHAARRSRELRREYRQRRHAEDHARWCADHDTLTGLFNRRYLEAYLGGCRNDTLLTAMMVDLRDLKRINDLRGHDTGDRILQEIANRLTAGLPDAIVTRYGGDEFVALLPGRSSEEAMPFAERIVEALRQPVMIGEETHDVAGSIGLATMPDDVEDGADLIRMADIARSQARRQKGTALEVFHPVLLEEIRETARRERELREAIQNDRIRPYYQPLVELQTGRVAGCEALARWFRADGTQVPPSDFIPLAEKVGLIDELSTRLLRQACSDAMDWDERVTLSFNISAQQLNDTALAFKVASILKETSLPAHRLELEITESTFIQNAEVALDVLAHLKTLGVRIALDDFGTGYSSLSQLAKLQIDRVKIDRSFVMQCMADERSMSVVQAIVSLSRTLNLATTAEGIEGNDQYLELQKAGCEIGQGYLFSKALSSSDFQAWLERMTQPADGKQVAAFG